MAQRNLMIASSGLSLHSSLTGQWASKEEKRVPIKLLQCNNEQCQYEYRADGCIQWVSQNTHLVDLSWQKKPACALVIKKPNSSDASKAFQQVVNYLHNERGIKIMVEQPVFEEFPQLTYLCSIVGVGEECGLKRIDASADGGGSDGVFDGLDPAMFDRKALKLEKELETREANLKKADFVVCLGGDGTILWVSGMFKGPCPPVVSFAMGSLGFLTPFDYSEYKRILDAVIQGSLQMGVRTRIECKVHDDMRQLQCVQVALNEATVDRGSSPFLTNITCYCNDRFVTTAQGDGLIIATPTGSTAYSLAAGGSMVHPDVPGILLTPISTQSLQFRPIIFPDSSVLRLEIPKEHANNAWVSFDGRDNMMLKKGWTVTISNSKWPIPILARRGEKHDWFTGVMECLHWNNRKAQGSFDRSVSGKEDAAGMEGAESFS